MELLWDLCNYLLDFQKVRSFQEKCGLKAKPKDEKDDQLYEFDMLKNQCHKDELQMTSNKRDNYIVEKWHLYYLFRFGSVLGTEVFYITFIPFMFWNFDPSIGRKMVVVWVVTMYIGQALKDLIRWPRPSCPPAFKLESRVQAEYGLPSTHAIAGTVLPFSILLSSYQQDYDISLGLGTAMAVSWCVLVSLSRIYVGMHSFLDIVAGVVIGAIYLLFSTPYMEMVDEYTLTSAHSPWLIIISHFLLGYFYPSVEPHSTTRGDTVMILAAGAGIQCASWLLHQYHIDLSPSLHWNQTAIITYFAKSLSRFVLGAVILALTRHIFKRASLSLLCWVTGTSKQVGHIEVVYKFVTYGAVGFAAVTAPLVFNLFPAMTL